MQLILFSITITCGSAANHNSSYFFGIVMGRGKPLFLICVGNLKPDGLGGLALTFINFDGTLGILITFDAGSDKNVAFAFKLLVASAVFTFDSDSGLFKLPFELPDDRLCKNNFINLY